MGETEKIDLSFLGLGDEEEDAGNVLADYYLTVAKGPMTAYRRIHQSGHHQGQSYYAHVIDGVGVIHKLRAAGILDLDDTEERVMLAAYTIHDINKLPWHNPRESRTKYADVATSANIRAELARIRVDDFFPEWETYVEDIRLLAHSHQHDAKPLPPRDRTGFRLGYERLRLLGELMQGIDNLDLSPDLAERAHKNEFLARVMAVTGRQLRWVTHRLGENRGLLTNIIHNVVVGYLHERHTHDDANTGFVDLLYYPEGVAYLLGAREPFTWTEADILAVARRVAREVSGKKGSSYQQFIKNTKDGIKVDRAALEGGATYGQIMNVIYGLVTRKTYKEQDYSIYLGKLRADLEEAAAQAGQPCAAAAALLAGPPPLVPLDQDRMRRGALAYAYRNLLENHLKKELKTAQNRDPWERVYRLMDLPEDRYALYNAIFATRRGALLAHESAIGLDDLFDRMSDDLTGLVGTTDAEDEGADVADYLAYLQNNLEVRGGGTPDFKAHLRQYIANNHRQCGTCSTARPTGEWMAANAPTNLTVQFFSNRLAGGSPREPKRNLCAICRAQFILEKLAWPAHNDKHGGDYTTFYLHLYPFAFFTAPYLAVMRKLFSTIRLESRSTDEDGTAAADSESRSWLFDTAGYLTAWHRQYDQHLGKEWEQQAKQFLASPRKLNGVGRSVFHETVGNTPTLPLTAPGDNYGKQFLFALEHALMVADLFACRVVLSRTPTPLFTGEYLHTHQMVFFVDGVPRNLRWLLPGDGYRDLESYRDSRDPQEYARRTAAWSNELPDADGYLALANMARRLGAAHHLARELSTTNSKGIDNTDDLLLELLTAAADDPLALYYVADRAIEQKVKAGGSARGTGRTKAAAGITPEHQANHLRRQVAGQLHQLAKEPHA